VARRVVERNIRSIIRRLQSEGWVIEKAEGSHHKFRHPKHAYPIIVPHPKKDMPVGTARAIARAAGWLDKDDPLPRDLVEDG
jgi:predicted RNA binding protein YcfA (HicA-like mRNA interferase family)